MMTTQTQSTSGVSLTPMINPPDAERHLFDGFHRHPAAWDELFAAQGAPPAHCATLVGRPGQLSAAEFQRLRANADLVFINQGITFSVYSDRRGVEKIFPFDLIPRPVASAEWKVLEAGLVQR